MKKNKDIDFWGIEERKKPLKKGKNTFDLRIKPKKKDMNWTQAKRRYPKLNPYGDADRDGLKNWLDCKPFDKKKQGWAHRGTSFNRERSSHVRMMTPEKFLRTTHREVMDRKIRNNGFLHVLYTDDDDKGYESYVMRSTNFGEQSKKLGHVIKQPKGKMTIPYLEYDEQGRPTGHEGRNRAYAAQQEGVKLIPVTIAKKLKEPRDWKNMRKTWKYKTTKHDWRNDLENQDEVISSASADRSIKEQREYGEPTPEVLQNIEEEIEEYEKE